jgi:LmbE family N-acetylglucosaminyl deacetylase
MSDGGPAVGLPFGEASAARADGLSIWVMHAVRLGSPSAAVLCLGAHCDDIEIGCGGTLLRWRRERPELEVHWVVFSADATRRGEAEAAAARFLGEGGVKRLVVHDFRDGFFPYEGVAVKEAFEHLKHSVRPDVVFTHQRDDRHQDHRLVSELTWNTFRDHLILEYEVPKWDGDLGQPNAFSPLEERDVDAKVAALVDIYSSQRDRRWFDPDTFRGLMRLRGVECGTRFAEAFHARKLVLST